MFHSSLNRRSFMVGMAALAICPRGACAMSTSGMLNGFKYWVDVPATPAPGHPCVLIAPTGSTGYVAGGVSQTLINQLLAAGVTPFGFWLPGLDGAEFGFGAQNSHLDTLVPAFTSLFGLAVKPSVYLQSKAGLDGLPWMVRNPTAWVRAALLYAACDPLSYPAGSFPSMIPALLSAYAVPDMATFTANCEPTHNALNGASVLPGANIMEWAGTIDTAVPLPQNGALLSAACGSAIRPFVGNHIAYTNYDIGRFLIGSTMVPTGTDFLRLAFSGTSVALTNVGSQQLFPDIIVSDPNTIYNPSTGTVTIKNAGKYSLTASCIPSTTAGNFWIGVDVNGSFFTVGGESVISAPAVPSVHAEAWFDAGDTLQVWVNNTLAGATLSSASFGTYFSLAKVG